MARRIEVALQARTARLKWFCLHDFWGTVPPSNGVMKLLLAFTDDPDVELSRTTLSMLGSWLKLEGCFPLTGYDRAGLETIINKKNLKDRIRRAIDNASASKSSHGSS